MRNREAWPNNTDSPNCQGKSLFYLFQLSRKFGFSPANMKPGTSPPSTFQTVHFTPQAVLKIVATVKAVATVIVVLSFLF